MLHEGMHAVGRTKMSSVGKMKDRFEQNKCVVAAILFTKFRFDIFQGDFFYLMDSGVCEIFKDG